MVVTAANSINLGIKAVVVEPDINRQGSDYIMQHYDALISYINSHNITDKASDLLQDVFESVWSAECNGEGYNPQYRKDDSEYNTCISIEQFIYGRIKLYCRNTKYSSAYVETARVKKRTSSLYLQHSIDESGQILFDFTNSGSASNDDSDAIMITTSAASWSSDGSSDTNDSFQMAYSMAMVADDTDDITDLLSLREEIDYCIDVGDLHGVKILQLFKNLDKIAEAFSDKRKKKVKSCDSIFKPIIDMVKYNDDFAESLTYILSFSEKNRNAFEGIIATY